LSFVSQLLIGRLSDFFPARNLLIIFAIAGCVGTFLLALPGLVQAFIAVIVIGFTLAGVVGCLYRYIAESFPTRARGTGVLFVGAFFGLGGVVGPIGYGAFMNSGNFAGTAILGAAAALLAGLVLLAGKVIAPRKELEEIQV
jgi:MFS family permease